MTKLEYLNECIDLLCGVFPEKIIRKDEVAAGNLAYYIENIENEKELDRLKLEIRCKDVNEFCHMIIEKIHKCYSMTADGIDKEIEQMCYYLLEADYIKGMLDTINLIGQKDFPDWYRCYINMMHKIER